MWDTYNEDRAPRADIGRIVRIAIFAAIGVIIFGLVSNQSVNLIMNVQEFGEVFTRPLYYSILSGVVLASIVLIRVNFKNRHSVTWYGIRMLVNFLRRSDYESSPKTLRYSEFQMSRISFALWQLTKVVLFAPLFGNIMFGMAVEYAVEGNDVGLGSIANIFSLPFATMTEDENYAQQNVLPMFPTLTLLIPPLLAAIGLRLLLYLGISSAVNIVSQYAIDSRESKPKFLAYVSTIEIIVGVAIFWIGFNMFFSINIDYNTRYGIAGAMTLGAAFVSYGLVDRRHARVMIYPTKRHMYSRLFTAIVVVGLAGSIMLVNKSIADLNAIEWNGPYVAQQIEVNRYMYDLDRVEIKSYRASQPTISSTIGSIADQNSEILDNIRVWDEANAKTKLDQQRGQRNDLEYFDFDLLRFDEKMYWTGSTMPIVPNSSVARDAWTSQHFFYTHSEAGIGMLEADNGNVIDESKFFKQRRIYYGESSDTGLFSTYWSGYPTVGKRLQEVGGVLYNGTGGVDIAPPLSWMFEPNFMVSYPGTAMHVMRYKDIHDRMDLLYPYFVYDFCFDCTPNNPQPKQVESFAVTDGTNTYWLMPLVVAINTSDVPWSSSSSSSFMLELVGYSLIDTYNGTVQIIVTGDDYFSKMFLDEYKDIGATREVPGWLSDQIRYPEEMFIWTVSKFNTYHVTDPKTYIDSKDFYDVAAGSNKLAPQYIFTKPPEFTNPQFVGIQELQLKETQPKNIVGYMTAQNDLENLGKMTFYSLPSNSTTKFIDPATAKTILTGSTEYSEAKQALGKATPLLGEVSLYKVGDYEIYFVPVFSDSGGRQLSLVGAVGAVSTGNPNVGVGSTPTKAFESYLQKLFGVPSGQLPGDNQTAPDRQNRIQAIEKIFSDAGVTVVKPTAVSAPVKFEEAKVSYNVESDLVNTNEAIHGFVQKFALEGGRVYEWQEGTMINFGFLRDVEGVAENHYLSVEVG